MCFILFWVEDKCVLHFTYVRTSEIFSWNFDFSSTEQFINRKMGKKIIRFTWLTEPIKMKSIHTQSNLPVNFLSCNFWLSANERERMGRGRKIKMNSNNCFFAGKRLSNTNWLILSVWTAKTMAKVITDLTWFFSFAFNCSYDSQDVNTLLFSFFRAFSVSCLNQNENKKKSKS